MHLDNNATERALRVPVVERENHYGSRSRHGTEAAATLSSLQESAKLCSVDPKAYLRAVVLVALNGEPPLLPHQYAAQARQPRTLSPPSQAESRAMAGVLVKSGLFASTPRAMGCRVLQGTASGEISPWTEARSPSR